MNIEFTAQPLFSKGTSTPAVARTVLQARGLLDAFPLNPSKKQAVLEISMTLMKHFIACEEIRQRLDVQVAAGRASIDAGQITVERDRLLQLPGVTNLESEAEAFLHNAKLALADVGRLFGPLHGKAFDHRFQKVRAWLQASHGDKDPILLMLLEDAPWIERVINMRNAAEHPKKSGVPLVVKNFRATQAEPLVIASPAWAYGNEPLADILNDMDSTIDHTLTLYEDVLVDGILRIARDSVVTIAEIPVAERDAEMPIRFIPALKSLPPSA